MNLPSICILACLVITQIHAALFTVDDFSDHVYLDETQHVELAWTLLNDTHVEIGVICNTPGWCAIGISKTGQMPDSDIMFFWIDDNNGSVYLQDRFAESRSVPLLDSDDKNDLYLLDGMQEDDISYIRFIRSIYACDDDSSDDLSFEIGTSRILYAYNDNDPTSVNFDSLDNVEYHGATQMGSKSVNILTSGTTSNIVELEDSAEYIDLRIPNHTLPTDGTYYRCALLSLPRKNETHHIVTIEPLVVEGNEGVVHHMVLYHCPASNVDTSNIGMSEDCVDWAEMSIPSAKCQLLNQGGSPIYGWAIGGETYTLPAHVGIEMGGDLTSDTTLQYIVLEIHYDNPNELSNIQDNSGFRVYYTPDLREYSASGFWSGLLTSEFRHFIPPGMSNATNYAYCGTECLEAAIPETGVTIISSLLHAHTAGTSVKASIIRNRTEIAMIDDNQNYDFDYQTTTYLNEPITIFPGDMIKVECTYDTLDRNETTYGGYGTYQEMCVVWLTVYPKIELTSCLSMHSVCANAECKSYSQFYYWFVFGLGTYGYIDDSTYLWTGTSDDAIAFYNDLWTNDIYLAGLEQFCLDQTFGSLVQDAPIFYNAPNSSFPSYVYSVEATLQNYEYPDYCAAPTVLNGQNGNNNSRNDDAWVNILIASIASIVGIAMVVLAGVYYLFQKRNRDRNDGKGSDKAESMNISKDDQMQREMETATVDGLKIETEKK